MTEPHPPQEPTLESDDGLAVVIEGLAAPSGQFMFRGWTLPYWLDEPAEDDGAPTEVSARRPGGWDVRPRERENRYLPFLFVWEGVPEAFKKIILYHEAQEATLALGDAEDYVVGGPQVGRMDRHAAHAVAARLHASFAERILDAAQLEEFRKWEASLQGEAMPF
jgi:hypothetical protein